MSELQRPRLFRITVGAALCAVLLLGGCSAVRVGYNQADWVAYRWLDAYAGFDETQTKGVREALAALFVWHRKTELPDYAELLLKIDADISANVNAERTCGWWSAVRVRLDRVGAQAAPAMVGLAAALKPAQFESIERRYAKTNAEFRDEFAIPDRARRTVEAAKRVVSRAQWVYGDLDAFQRERIERWMADSPYDPELALEERLRRQQDTLQTLRRLAEGRGDRAKAEADIRTWIQRLGQSPRESYRQHAARVLQFNCRLAADIHNITSATQRRTASAKLKAWAADMRALSAEGGG